MTASQPTSRSSQPTRSKHFRFNPVELAIFTGISLVLTHQLYSLFYDGYGSSTASRLAQLPTVAWDKGADASGQAVAPLFLSYELKCDQTVEERTTAGKFRLAGAICGKAEAGDRKPASATGLVDVQVMNLANKFTATVFTDGVAAKFSTDYVPLNLGKNPIRIEFRYSNGDTVTKNFMVEKTEN